IKRGRSTKAEVEARREALFAIIDEGKPMTVRQVFYQATIRGGARHRRRPEDAIQRAVFQHLRARGAPGVFAFHPTNAGYRTPFAAPIVTGVGVTPVVPELFAAHNGRCFAHELQVEGGRATDKQLACIAALREAGAFTCIAEGLDRAIACLEAWGLLVGRRQ